MTEKTSIADHWGSGDIFARIMTAMAEAGMRPEDATVESMGPMDHFHARGFPATVDLADRLPAAAGQHLIDIGSGLGGPARYIASRFACNVSGIDITAPFVDAANRLSAMLKMEDQVDFQTGDGQDLPFGDEVFDGGYSQHVTMNVADRPRFFAEAARVLRPGGFFALTEHALGPKGDPHYPLPWSEDGSGAYLIPPDETVALMQQAGFTDIVVEETGPKYVRGYQRAMDLAAKGQMPKFGIHRLMGETGPQKTVNAARNIEEGRTCPIQLFCRKAG